MAKRKTVKKKKSGPQRPNFELHDHEDCKYFELYKTMSLGVVYQNAKGEIIEANPAAEEILGLSLAQMQGRESIDPRWKSVREDGSPFPGEEHPAMLALKTGKRINDMVMGVYNPQTKKYRWISIDAVPEFKKGGKKPFRVYTMFRDITERKIFFEELKASEELYKTLFNSSREAIMILAPPDWRFVSANKATLNLFKVKDKEKFLSLDPWSLSPKMQPDGSPSKEKAKEMINKAVKEKSVLFEWTHQKLNGETFSATVLLTRFTIGGKRYVQAAVRDITERKKLEEKLKKEQTQTETILDSVPAMIFYKDRKNRFVKVNQKFAEVMGLEKKELEGRPMSDFYPEDQAKAYHKDDIKVIKSGEPKRNIVEPLTISNETFWVKTDKVPYWDDEGNIIGVVGFSLDITKQKEAEERLKENLERMEKLNELMVGRELKMVELKKRVEELEKILNKK